MDFGFSIILGLGVIMFLILFMLVNANPNTVFCKTFLQKVAKEKCRLLQNSFVGCCTYIL